MLKMSSKIYFSFLLLSVCFSFGQVNLVPNPSFEDTVKCPSTNANINDCANWMNFGNSPDYYNACASSGLNVPNAQFGYQYAHSGIGMPGIITWYNPNQTPNFREFIGAQLTASLVPGTKYFMSFFINLTGYLQGWRQYAANKIGIRFSTVPSNSVNIAPINNSAHMYTSIIYQDTVNWLKLSGSFIADSAYTYVIIGNFFDDNNTDTLSYSGPSFGGMGAYYYLDDVCVTTDSLYNNSNWWATSVKETYTSQNIHLYPNPSSGKLFFQAPKGPFNYKISVLNPIGKECKGLEIKNGDNIDMSGLPNGIYFVKIYYANFVQIKKIILYNP